jgi:hypothetical protein
VNLHRRSGRSSPAAVVVAANTAYLPSLRAGEESSKREIAVSNSMVRRGSRNRGAVSAGAHAISMVAAARAGVDHFWLPRARDEGGSEETTDSSVPPRPGRRML